MKPWEEGNEAKSLFPESVWLPGAFSSAEKLPVQLVLVKSRSH